MIDPKTELIKLEFQSGEKTAKKAAAILVSKNLGFIVPTAGQKLNLLVAFAKKSKVELISNIVIRLNSFQCNYYDRTSRAGSS